MKVKCSPVRLNEELVVTVNGDKITFNGIEVDFTQLPDGARLPCGSVDCQWIFGDVYRANGEIHLTIMLPHDEKASNEVRFPECFDDYVNVSDGLIKFPLHGGAK